MVYSDNVKRVKQDLKKLWESIKNPKLQNLFSERGIIWWFIAE